MAFFLSLEPSIITIYMIKGIIVGIIAIGGIIQFFRPQKNQSADTAKDITTVYTVPQDVEAVLKKSCYDCHSNNTVYLWYDKIQPVRWYIEKHIKDGKAHLNFSEFASYSKKKQIHKLDEIAEVVEDDEMPLSSYTLMHRDAKLSAAQKELLISWASSLVNAADEAAENK